VLLVAWLAVPAASWLVRPSAGRLITEGAELSRQSRWPEAISVLDRAAAAAPRNAEAHFLKGVVLERLRRPAEAADELEAAVLLDASRADAYFLLARLYEKAGVPRGLDLAARWTA